MASRKRRNKSRYGGGVVIAIAALLCTAACVMAVYMYMKTTPGTGQSDEAAGKAATGKAADGEDTDSGMNSSENKTSDESTATTDESTATTDEVTEAPDPEVILEEKLTDMVDAMSLEEKTGQMFFVRGDPGYDQAIFDTYHPGGILLFGSDVEDKTYTEVQDYIGNFQQMSSVPLFIGIDEEGGTVSRVSQNPNLVDTPFQSPRQLYAEGGMDAVIEDSHRKSALLLDLGINVNLAPVVDYSVDSWDFMYDRAFGDNIDETCDFAGRIVSAMKDDGMGSVLKHFPGYGSNGDTHTNMITDDRDYNTFVSQDFLPFEAGIEAGAECVLVCHNIVTCMDADWPASLSERVHRELRDTLGFDGVIITDDLAMDGVTDFCGADTAAVQAIKAGNDMMIVSDFYTQYDAVIQAVKDGTISEDRLDESVVRILRWKYDLGVIHIP